MLDIEIKGKKNRSVRAIILDKPSKSSVWGVVECVDCAWRSFIVSEGAEAQTEEIERFALHHSCGYVPKSHIIKVKSMEELKQALSESGLRE